MDELAFRNLTTGTRRAVIERRIREQENQARDTKGPWSPPTCEEITAFKFQHLVLQQEDVLIMKYLDGLQQWWMKNCTKRNRNCRIRNCVAVQWICPDLPHELANRLRGIEEWFHAMLIIYQYDSWTVAEGSQFVFPPPPPEPLMSFDQVIDELALEEWVQRAGQWYDQCKALDMQIRMSSWFCIYRLRAELPQDLAHRLGTENLADWDRAMTVVFQFAEERFVPSTAVAAPATTTRGAAHEAGPTVQFVLPPSLPAVPVSFHQVTGPTDRTGITCRQYLDKLEEWRDQCRRLDTRVTVSDLICIHHLRLVLPTELAKQLRCPELLREHGLAAKNKLWQAAYRQIYDYADQQGLVEDNLQELRQQDRGPAGSLQNETQNGKRGRDEEGNIIGLLDWTTDAVEREASAEREASRILENDHRTKGSSSTQNEKGARLSTGTGVGAYPPEL